MYFKHKKHYLCLLKYIAIAESKVTNFIKYYDKGRTKHFSFKIYLDSPHENWIEST